MPGVDPAATWNRPRLPGEPRNSSRSPSGSTSRNEPDVHRSSIPNPNALFMHVNSRIESRGADIIPINRDSPSPSSESSSSPALRLFGRRTSTEAASLGSREISPRLSTASSLRFQSQPGSRQQSPRRNGSRDGRGEAADDGRRSRSPSANGSGGRRASSRPGEGRQGTPVASLAQIQAAGLAAVNAQLRELREQFRRGGPSGT